MTDDITPADIDVAQYAGETIRLTASITRVLDTPRVIEAEISSTGKTIAAPHPTREDTTWRLDTATILAGELEARGSYGVELYTPESFQRTEDANYGPGPQAGTDGASDAADLPTPTHRVGGERVALADGGSDDDDQGDDEGVDDGAADELGATATVQVFMTAGHSRHEEVDTESERFQIARDLRGFGLDAFEEFDRDPDRAATLALDALGDPETLATESFATTRELLQFVYDTCQGPRTATTLPYDGSETRSLTVGDVILVDGDAWMVARLGFEAVPMAAADLRDDEDDAPTVATDGGQPRVTTEDLPAGTAPDLSSVYVHRSPSGDSALSDYIFCTFGQRSVGGLSVPGGSVAEWVETQVLQQFDSEDEALDELLPTEAEREAAGEDPVRVGRLHFDRRAGEVVALELDADAFDEQRGGRSIVTDGGWVSDADTEWCPECQRERVDCAHRDDGLRADGGFHTERLQEFAEYLSGMFGLDFRAVPEEDAVEMTASAAAMRDAVRRLAEQSYAADLDHDADPTRVVVHPSNDDLPPALADWNDRDDGRRLHQFRAAVDDHPYVETTEFRPGGALDAVAVEFVTMHMTLPDAVATAVSEHGLAVHSYQSATLIVAPPQTEHAAALAASD